MRPFGVVDSVTRGRQLGRRLGFPTANVGLADYVVPRFGVYATRTRLPDGRNIPGVANIGVNPTVDGITQPPSMKREPRSTVMMDLLRCGVSGSRLCSQDVVEPESPRAPSWVLTLSDILLTFPDRELIEWAT